jgi:hypothetical protein
MLTTAICMSTAWLAVVLQPRPAEAARRQAYRGAFRAQMHQGASAGLVVAGVLDLQINPSDGSFVGTVTPAIDHETGLTLPTVLFHLDGEVLTPSVPAVLALPVRGSVAGHAANLVVLDVGGPGQHLHLAGTNENLVKKGAGGHPGRMKGMAVGPGWGSIGEFGATTEGVVGTVGGTIEPKVIVCLEIIESSTGKVVLRICLVERV